MNKKVSVVQGPGEVEVSVEILAQSIEKIGRAMEAVRASRVRDETIIVLVANTTGMSKTLVRNVIEALHDLERRYLKPREKA